MTPNNKPAAHPMASDGSEVFGRRQRKDAGVSAITQALKAVRDCGVLRVTNTIAYARYADPHAFGLVTLIAKPDDIVDVRLTDAGRQYLAERGAA